MQTLTVSCPACGGTYEGRLTNRFVTCEYCGTRYALGKDALEAMGFVDADGDGFSDNDPAAKAEYEADDNSDPMYQFARDVCEKFLRAADKSSFASSNKILKGLGLTAGDDIYLIHDDTMFKSGKNGFAITREGLYCREMGEKSAHFVSWSDYAAGDKPLLEDAYIRQDGVSVCYFTDDSDVRDIRLTRLYERLYYHAKKVM